MMTTFFFLLLATSFTFFRLFFYILFEIFYRHCPFICVFIYGILYTFCMHHTDTNIRQCVIHVSWFYGLLHCRYECDLDDNDEHTTIYMEIFFCQREKWECYVSRLLAVGTKSMGSSWIQWVLAAAFFSLGLLILFLYNFEFDSRILCAYDLTSFLWRG